MRVSMAGPTRTDAAYRRNLAAAILASLTLHGALFLSIPTKGGWARRSASHIGFEGPTEILPEINPLQAITEEQERTAAARTLAGAVVDARIEILPDPDAAGPAPPAVSPGLRGRDAEAVPVLELTESWNLRNAGEPTSRSNEFIIESMVRPEYPSIAIELGIEALVRVEAQIDRQGRVVSARVLNADVDELFVDGTLQAMRRWRFRPYRIDGRPVEFTVLVPFRYRLE